MRNITNKNSIIKGHHHRNSSSSNNVGVAKVIAKCLVLCISMQMCCGSAIPIWELLTRNEKMSYLYSTFGQLVSVHCKATAAKSAIPVNQCKRDLLAYGYEKLQTFSDQQLDHLDPYQRDANELAWSAIMRDHPNSTLITTRKPLPTPSDSSIIILTHHKTDSTNTAGHSNNGNPIFDSEVENKHQLAMGMDNGHNNGKTQSDGKQKPYTETFLSGPLVFRVRPDGSPVEEDKHKPLPHDDDLEAYQLSTIALSNTNSGTAVTAISDRPKHRKIAMISDLKQQHWRSLALKRDLQPPYQHLRIRRQHKQNLPIAGRSIPLKPSFQNFPFGSNYYTKNLA